MTLRAVLLCAAAAACAACDAGGGEVVHAGAAVAVESGARRHATIHRRLAPGEDRGPRAAPRVVLVASEHAEIATALAAGLRLAFEEARASGGPDLALVVAGAEGAWGSAAEGAVREALDGDAVALVAPPERRTAHLLVQFGTKVRLPVVSTSPSPSVVGAGSPWVVAVVPLADPQDAPDDATPPAAPPFDSDLPAAASFVASFRSVHGRAPGAWDATGYDAGRTVVEGVRRNGLHRAGLLGALVHGGPCAGAGGPVAVGAGPGPARRR